MVSLHRFPGIENIILKQSCELSKASVILLILQLKKRGPREGEKMSWLNFHLSSGTQIGLGQGLPA